VSLVVLAAVELDNIWHNDQLEQTGKKVGAKVTPESFHNLEKLRDLQK
jgi:hypothetical protein